MAYTKSKNVARATSASLSCTTVTGVLRHRDRALRATKRQLSLCAELLTKRSLFSVEVERLFSSSELEGLNAATTRRGSTTQPNLEVHAHHAADILTRILGLLVDKGAGRPGGISSVSSSSSPSAAGLVLRRCIAAARACVETIVAALAEDESAGTEGETSLVLGGSSSSTSRLTPLGRLLVLDRQATSLLVVHNESYGEGDDHHALAHEENAEFIDGVIARLLVVNCKKTSTAGSLARHLFGKQYRLRQERSATGSGSSSCTPSTAPTAAFFVPQFVDEAWQFVFAGGNAVGKTSFEKLRRCLAGRLRLGQGRAVEDTAGAVEGEDPLAALESALWFPPVHDAASLAGLLRAAAETMMNVRQDEHASVARAVERHGYAIDVLLELWLFAVASNGNNFLAADTSRGSLRRELIEGSMVSEEGGLGELLECARWEGYSVSTEAAAIGLFGVCPTKHPILLKHVVDRTSLQPSFREFVATIDGAPLAAPGSAPLAASSASANGSRAPERELPRNNVDHAELDLS